MLARLREPPIFFIRFKSQNREAQVNSSILSRRKCMRREYANAREKVDTCCT